ncbi:Acid sphingomyelinase-like phosphodiesterase 3b [Chionoecetes opilio]|uniref:Acid sphingomyelinase-like phosphodiesterase 3b n=1 Tax=Chionoecetes opilio TaxID=41210 RepID=A0A8J4XU43_CHIOP|nr:Acid sphingomyelinase-like phosphodiesterase 3b [Chionoecetes opilio]
MGMAGRPAGSLAPWLLCLVMGVVVSSPAPGPESGPHLPHQYQGKFWQITDIHWDLRYDEEGNPTKMCHTGYDADGHNSMWGNYNCDSPWPLVKSAIQAMVEVEAQPDFVLWTGDNAPHSEDPMPDFSVIFKTLSNLTVELRTAFHASIPVLPVLGNHDAYPKDDYPVAGEEFYGKYLHQGGWATLLPAEAQQEFVQGGYYSYKMASGVMVLVVNTNLYYAANTLGVDVPDPCGQFAWLRSRLQSARDQQFKVIITAHAPPGYFERMVLVPFFNASYNDAYVDLLNDFGEVILVQIYGHEHTDSFKLFSGPKARETYGLSSLSPVNMANLHSKLKSNDTLFQTYYLLNSAGYNNGLCDSSCKKSHLCAIAYLKMQDVVNCRFSNSTKSHSLSREDLSQYSKVLAEGMHNSYASQLILILVVVSMVLTVVLAVSLAVMLFMVSAKRRQMVPAEANFPILNLSRTQNKNYRKLP